MDKEMEKCIMDDKVLIEQENVILQRKSENEENSYTCYLFKSGLDPRIRALNFRRFGRTAQELAEL